MRERDEKEGDSGKLRLLRLPNPIVNDSESKLSEFVCWLQYESDSKSTIKSTIAISM